MYVFNFYYDRYYTSKDTKKLSEKDGKKLAEEIISNFENMINEKPYDGNILEELNIYDTVYRQPNRKNCALLPFRAIKEIIETKE